MPSPIEDYALIGNTRTAALVAKNGSIDWLCVPRFDSAACFAALLGEREHGRWLLAPAGDVRSVRRGYRDGTLVLETDYETENGAVRVIDCMPLWEGRADVVRVVKGLRGSVPMRMEIIVRFDYGSVVPWVHRLDGGLAATAGPDSLELRTVVDLRPEGFTTVAELTVSAGSLVPFVLSYFPSHESPPLPLDAHASIDATTRWWRRWSEHCTYRGQWREQVLRSLITLKALTYAPTGGIVAAPTTSLPEQPGGSRNWDYRFCWLRDATFTLYALLIAGYHREARAWREWLLRVAAGCPQDLQILYGIAGERRLSEIKLDWLPGYQGAVPVRVGNAAAGQFQLDVYGEVMDSLHLARVGGLEPEKHAWEIQRVILDFLESAWERPDNGIWEVRGPQRHFTHSKVMAWVAMDRAVKAVERFKLDGPVDRWRKLRQAIHEQVCRQGFDADRGAFVQYYGSKELDASALTIPLVGFLPPKDPRVRGTVEAIKKELTVDGLVLRITSTANLLLTIGAMPSMSLARVATFLSISCFCKIFVKITTLLFYIVDILYRLMATMRYRIMTSKISIYRYAVLMALLILTAACATRTPEQKAELTAIADQDIICPDEDTCRDMWVKASDWARDNAGWRFLRTEFNRIIVECNFVRSDGYQIAYMIERIPLDGEKSRLKLTFGRNSSSFACTPPDTEALEADFKRTVLG